MTSLTYSHVGATRTGSLPPGYRHLRYRVRIGAGEAVLSRAAEAILTFQMHRSIGTRVASDSERAAAGVRLTLGIGPLRAPCEIVWSSAGGFAYGTRPGHPATGEEAFEVTLDDAGQVWFTVTAFSRPAGALMRLAGPFAVLFQQAYARLCGRALRRLSTVNR
ncbi:DUF1990 domain-containing protein [Actinoplanes sp. OR16]|uniref:DUF1990 family protein n=1 Tax=Actinoplanes sp. OR16 TaxID=946334 RepID=UPI000F7180CF|nr:DUF1990 domain-containing protein [Actinoplanes sp. OR16]BBH63903.1 DUF1990 domain-containing protein [Actinoplanes sp. OR16]